MAEHPAAATGAGTGGVAPPDPRRSVFINCPYDPEYEPLADALLLAVVACGFSPRSALESGLAAIPRVERIFHAIHSSKYSIHDPRISLPGGQHKVPLSLGGRGRG